MIADYTEYELKRNEKARFHIAIVCLFMFIGWLFYQSILPIVCYPVLAGTCEAHYRKSLVKKRKAILELQFRDLLYSLSASFATGRQMREALIEAEERLGNIYNEDSLICLELSQIVHGINECRESEDRLFRDFADRCCISEVKIFSEVCSICGTMGGDLEKAAEKAIYVLLDKIETNQAIRVITVQKRYEVLLLTSIPIVLILFLQIASPGYLSVLYETVSGRIMMTMALAMVLCAYLWSMKLTRLEGN